MNFLSYFVTISVPGKQGLKLLQLLRGEVCSLATWFLALVIVLVIFVEVA